MSRANEARHHVLRSIRENLAASAPHNAAHHADHISSVNGPAGRASLSLPILSDFGRAAHRVSETSLDRMTQFRRRLEAVGAECVVVRGEGEAARAVERIVTRARARRVVGSDAPLVRRVLTQAAGGAFATPTVDSLSRDGLFACEVGVTGAQWGIAETGTLVLESAREKNRLLSLVPPVHVALLFADRVCDSLGAALARVREVDDSGSLASRAITFITGPSRTSDIELTLTIGVHGPQTLHVIVLEGDAGNPGSDIQ
jgi:L-lactate dehydrogenase complex protein LldG